MIKKAHTGHDPCSNDDCNAMRRHCRKETTGKCLCEDKQMSTWIVLLDQIHCPLFHDKATDFRNRYTHIDHSNSNIDDEKSRCMKGKFAELEFGVSVDEWLSCESPPRFKCMEHEILFNDYHGMRFDTVEQMKYEIKQRHSSRSNAQRLNEEELLAIKVFTDQDQLQKEFCKSFRHAQTYLNSSMLIRRQQFYHWAHTLRRAFRYGHMPITRKLYRGVNQILQTPSFRPFCGQPTSTTTQWNVAASFSKGVGLILKSD
eukprot:134274_1